VSLASLPTLNSPTYPIPQPACGAQVPGGGTGHAGAGAAGEPARGGGDAARPPAEAARNDGHGCECLILHVALSGITQQLRAVLGNPVRTCARQGSGQGRGRCPAASC